MLVSPDGKPVFDSQIGFQLARSFGGANGLELGPYLTMAFQAFDAWEAAGMIGGGLECLIADGGLGCGPVATLQFMRTATFDP